VQFSFDKDIRLENNRSLLRPLQPSDAAGLQWAASSDPDLMKFTIGQIHTPELLQQYIAGAMQERAQHIRYPFLIIDKASGRYAGCTSFASVSNEDDRLEIGWTWLGKPFQRSGLNRSNKFLMLSYAFDELGAWRVELRTNALNIPSRTAIAALGATYEGTWRDYKKNPDGTRRSTPYWSILQPEWKESIREKLSAELATAPAAPVVGAAATTA
jgi:RimJ/RimL family protein N-acetyltransferase